MSQIRDLITETQLNREAIHNLVVVVNNQADLLQLQEREVVHQHEEVERQRNKRRAMKYRVGRLEARMEELSLQVEASHCRCGEEVNRGDPIEVEWFDEVALVEQEGDDYFDPSSTFGRYGRRLAHGSRLCQADVTFYLLDT